MNTIGALHARLAPKEIVYAALSCTHSCIAKLYAFGTERNWNNTGPNPAKSEQRMRL